MEEIKNDLNLEQSNSQVNIMVETAKNPQNAVRLEVTNKVSEKLRNNDEVSKKVEETAEMVVDASLQAVENEAQKAVFDSNTDKLQSYFNEHKEELETAGITEKTYMEDMVRAVKWHKKCAKLHWLICGWWMTLIRTFILKAKPFKIFLNIVGLVLNLGLCISIIIIGIKIFELIF